MLNVNFVDIQVKSELLERPDLRDLPDTLDQLEAKDRLD